VLDWVPLFDASRFHAKAQGRTYDYSPSRDRFVMILPHPGSQGAVVQGARMIRVQNSFTELEERVGQGR